MAEAAAVIGHTFTASLLARVCEFDEPDLLAALDELWHVNILREQGAISYGFSHEKLGEVAYSGLTPARRQALHRRTAEALAETAPDDLWGRAFHLEQCGMTRPAAELYHLAASHEADQAAFIEAQRGFARALLLMGDRAVPQKTETLIALAHVCDVTGDHIQASQAVTEALQITSAMESDPLIVVHQSWLRLSPAC